MNGILQDLIGAVELGGMNFVGGTLFFDGSMRIRESQRVDECDGWQDWRIGEITTRYKEFNAYYVDMIKSKMKPGISTVLCTRHVPHVLLNGHEPSHYSFYSEMKDLVHELPFDPEVRPLLGCGYTHRRVCGEILPGFMGINVGSDYGRLEMMEMILPSHGVLLEDGRTCSCPDPCKFFLKKCWRIIEK